MNIDRLEFLAMITFINAVIPNSEDSGKNCLFIRLEGENIICTGGGEHAIKKVILVRHQDIEEKSKIKPPKTFMIPKSTLASFKTLIDEHKAKCKKLAKNDPSHLYIDINHQELYSHGDIIKYQQPTYQFKNMEAFFEKKQAPATKMFIYPGDVSSVMTGFTKNKQVETVYSGEENCPIHYTQPATGYEAIYIPPPEEEQPTMGGDDE